MSSNAHKKVSFTPLPLSLNFPSILIQPTLLLLPSSSPQPSCCHCILTSCPRYRNTLKPQPSRPAGHPTLNQTTTPPPRLRLPLPPSALPAWYVLFSKLVHISHLANVFRSEANFWLVLKFAFRLTHLAPTATVIVMTTAPRPVNEPTEPALQPIITARSHPRPFFSSFP